MIHLGHEAARLLFDDPHGGGQFLVAQQAVVLAGRLQIVDRVEIDFRAVADGRIEIAGHGQVENEQRPLPRAAWMGRNSSRVTIGLSAPVVLITRSAATSAAWSSSHGRGLALPLARPAGRPARNCG